MTPDHVVLGSGGVLGDTWMSGLIAGLLDAGGPDLRLARRSEPGFRATAGKALSRPSA